jgi:RHS repeat-associated protein
VDGPLANDVVAYGYDELGRVTTRTIDGAANSQTMTYDSLGRVTNATNLLGTFGYTYEGVTGRPSSVSHPSGQTTTLAFETNVGDRRLKEIWHKLSGGATLSKFNYTTDAVANIKTWTQPPNVYEFGYDAADQLASAVLKGPGRTPPILKRYGYGYDKAGNRTTEQIDDAATASSHDNMNRLTSQQAGGALTVAGTLNEPATVTVQGKPATVSATNAFEGRAQVTSGTNTVVVQATDPSGNVRTNTYEVNQSGANKTLTYDGNGNMTGDGTRTFEWDAENRLIAVVQGALRSEFTYDGIGRRVRIVEKDGAATTSDKRILWCGVEICEERDSSGGTGVKRFFGQGVQDGGAAFFYARDHLGSIRDVTDSAGTIRARYDYDPWGRRTKLAGDKDADFGYTGHYEHVPTSLTLAPFRAYDSNVGRWTSEDPMGLDDGPNRYAYVFGRPVNATDPLGLVAGVDDAAYLAVGLMALMTLVAVAMVATKSPPALPPFPTTDPMPPGPPPQTPTPRPAPGPPPNVGTGTGTGTSTTMSPPSNVLPFPPRPQPTACATPTPRPPTVCSLVKGPYIKPPGGKWCQYSCIKDRKIIPLEIGPVPNGVPCDPTVILN